MRKQAQKKICDLLKVTQLVAVKLGVSADLSNTYVGIPNHKDSLMIIILKYYHIFQRVSYYSLYIRVHFLLEIDTT